MPCHGRWRSLVLAPKEHSFEQWLFGLPERASDPERGRRLAIEVAKMIAADPVTVPELTSWTLAETGTRSFETAFWKTIVSLAHGRFRTKDNADCFQDEPTRERCGNGAMYASPNATSMRWATT